MAKEKQTKTRQREERSSAKVRRRRVDDLQGIDLDWRIVEFPSGKILESGFGIVEDFAVPPTEHGRGENGLLVLLLEQQRSLPAKQWKGGFEAAVTEWQKPSLARFHAFRNVKGLPGCSGLWLALENIARQVSRGSRLVELIAENDFPNAKLREAWYGWCAHSGEKWLDEAQRKRDGLQRDQNKEKTVARAFRQAVSERVQQLPKAFDDAVLDLREIQHELRLGMADALTGLINAYAAEQPHDNYDERRKLASKINETLQGLGLALRCPNTGLPAILVVDRPVAESEYTRFRFDVRKPQGGRMRTANSKTLPELTVIEDSPRIEPLSGWAKRAQKSRSKESPREKGS